MLDPWLNRVPIEDSDQTVQIRTVWSESLMGSHAILYLFLGTVQMILLEEI